jgi:hypothetical protein
MIQSTEVTVQSPAQSDVELFHAWFAGISLTRLAKITKIHVASWSRWLGGQPISEASLIAIHTQILIANIQLPNGDRLVNFDCGDLLMAIQQRRRVDPSIHKC